ncbi:hypothetical protein [Noviherbaspirillum denitrificans]|uniref:Uncharacterized protein n=1 Tax=Noviherbaspirillum denitrificans TaxID=1968433 RepID=A0A254THY2_9BURK|nr:hypothetical protein [Noviherbaspirillum denitrificans]OWW22241.1 hypothetical protein AYR66_24815 [Noviherbaspirillum denitrificans]
MTESDIQTGLAHRITRRVFLRNMSMTAAAVAVTACGGGGASGTADLAEGAAAARATPTQQNPSAPDVQTAAADRAPVWNEIPTITFTEGVASTFSVAAYVSDDDTAALTILKNELALPPGVTFDSATRSFVYDGVGSAAATSGHILTAMEG